MPAMRLLVKSGLNIDQCDEQGFNLLHFLCESPSAKNFVPAIRFIVQETNAALDVVDSTGRRPVDYLSKLPAAQRKNTEIEDIITILSSPRSPTHN